MSRDAPIGLGPTILASAPRLSWRAQHIVGGITLGRAGVSAHGRWYSRALRRGRLPLNDLTWFVVQEVARRSSRSSLWPCDVAISVPPERLLASRLVGAQARERRAADARDRRPTHRSFRLDHLLGLHGHGGAQRPSMRAIGDGRANDRAERRVSGTVAKRREARPSLRMAPRQ